MIPWEIAAQEGIAAAGIEKARGIVLYRPEWWSTALWVTGQFRGIDIAWTVFADQFKDQDAVRAWFEESARMYIAKQDAAT